MRRTQLGVATGALLGFLDGASAWAYPEARSMIAAIVVGSTLKGLVTGLLAGLAATRVRSVPIGISLGIVVGWGLSSLVALGQPAHYWPIVLPGMLVGAITGFVTQRYPRSAALPSQRHIVAFAAAVATVCAGSGSAQPGGGPLAPLEFLIGRWEGASEGKPGTGSVRREYSYVLGSRFIKADNASTYPPQPGNVKGEKHEDIGFFSFDKSRNRLVLRQFHVEGFVNSYVAEPSTEAGTVTFTTEAIENIPPGWRARESYTLTAAGELVERFELAEPGKPFELYTRTQLRRVPR